MLDKKNRVEKNPYTDRTGLVYPRVSSKRQEVEGSGLGSQEERCISLLDAIGVPHEKTFPETYSGGGDFMKRPKMREMLAYIDERPHKKFLVVFDDLKRFARDTKFHINLRAAFRSRDVTLKCLNYDFDESPEGEFVETIFAAQGQLERQQNQRQVVQKMKSRLEAGYWPFQAKRGYSQIKNPLHGKILEPNKDAILIVEAINGFLNRTLVRKIDVCSFLVEKGFWKKLSPTTQIYHLTLMLSDPLYAGYIEYPKWDVKRRKGHHEGIITLETFERLQVLLKKVELSVRVRQDISPDFPLRGLVSCGHCKSRLTAAWSKQHRFPYYLCHNKACEHYGTSIRKKDIETRFVEILQRNALKPEVDKLVRIVFDRVWSQEVSAVKKQQADQAKNIAGLEEKEAQLTDLILTEQSDDLKQAYKKQLKRVANEIKEAQTSPEKIDLSIPYRTAFDLATKMLKNPYSAWESMDVFEQHRLFFFIFEEKLPYNHLTGYRTDDIPLTVRLFEDFAEQNSQYVVFV